MNNTIFYKISLSVLTATSFFLAVVLSNCVKQIEALQVQVETLRLANLSLLEKVTEHNASQNNAHLAVQQISQNDFNRYLYSGGCCIVTVLGLYLAYVICINYFGNHPGGFPPSVSTPTVTTPQSVLPTGCADLVQNVTENLASNSEALTLAIESAVSQPTDPTWIARHCIEHEVGGGGISLYQALIDPLVLEVMQSQLKGLGLLS